MNPTRSINPSIVFIDGRSATSKALLRRSTANTFSTPPPPRLAISFSSSTKSYQQQQQHTTSTTTTTNKTPEPCGKPKQIQHKETTRPSKNSNNKSKHSSADNNEGSTSPLASFFAHLSQQQQQQQLSAVSDHYYGGDVENVASALETKGGEKDSPQHRAQQIKQAKASRRVRAPYGFWRDANNHRLFLDWAGKQLGVRHLDDWYNINMRDVAKLGGVSLLDGYYNNSLQQALSAVYPEHEWLPWRFVHVPNGFWQQKGNDNDNDSKNKKHHRWFFDWAATQLDIKTVPDDWYGVTVEDIKRLGGWGLINQCYNSSLQQALSAVYPEHEWLPWRFLAVPQGFWHDTANHRRFFDWAAQQLGVRELPDDWYKVIKEDVMKLGGTGLLTKYYNSSLQQALAAVYPEHEWLPWRFVMAPMGFWENKENHRRFLDWAAKQLGFADANHNHNHEHEHDHEGWYAISRDDVYALGGYQLLDKYYGGSLIRALTAVYPEKQWDPWRFRRCELGKHELVDEPTMRRFVEGTLAPMLHVEKLEDWYRVSMNSARSSIEGYHTVVERHGGLVAVLQRLYPQQAWDERRLRGNDKKSSQRMLVLVTRQLFPCEEVIEEYLHPGLRFDSSDTNMTLDVWVPSLSLALEYQGEQHYHDTYVLGDNPAAQQQRDHEKAEACRRAGITLISVPYWWWRRSEDDVSRQQAVAGAIAAARPDLVERLRHYL